MPTKPEKPRQRPKKSGAKQLRDQTIIHKAIAGKKAAEIAAEVGVTRQTVSEVLNSDEMKKKVKEIDARLAKGIDDAIGTVLEAVKMDYNAARDLLKNYGSMKTQVDITHTFPKPTVIVRSSGERVILGVKSEDEDGTENQ